MDSVFFIYLFTGIVAIWIGYLGIRTIDFMFSKPEADRRYKHIKGAIHCYNDGQRRMAQAMVKGINDSIYEMYKKMEDL